MIRNLGRALSILARWEAREDDMHEDVSAFGAPGECHALVSKGEVVRCRRARKQAEAEARAPLRVIVREAARRGRVSLYSGDPRNRAYRRAVEQSRSRRYA